MDEQTVSALKPDFAQDAFAMLRAVLKDVQVSALNADIDSLMVEKGWPEALMRFCAAFIFPNVIKLVECSRVLPVAVNLLGRNLQLELSSLSMKRPVTTVIGTGFSSYAY